MPKLLYIAMIVSMDVFMNDEYGLLMAFGIERILWQF